MSVTPKHQLTANHATGAQAPVVFLTRTRTRLSAVRTRHLMNAYRRLPVQFSAGQGAWLQDRDGRRYLDGISGIAVCGLGHAHPAVTRAVAEQAGQLVHTSNLYHIDRQQELAEKLTALAGMERAFFCNSGAEANEAAVKLARLHGHRAGIAEPAVLTFSQAFHGRTLAMLAASDNAAIRAGFDPLPAGFVHAPWNELSALDQLAAEHANIVAALIEPVQGEAGIRIPDPGYLQGLRAACDRHGWLLMFDEVQTGNARSGHYFACQRESVRPDVLTTAKGLGNGVPIGACLATGAVAELFEPGQHASTFGGNPLACAAATAVIDAIDAESLRARAETLGQRLADRLKAGLAEAPIVRALRAYGMMFGIELERPVPDLAKRALARGVLVNMTAQDRTLRLLPPLILSDAEADQLADSVIALVQEDTQDALA